MYINFEFRPRYYKLKLELDLSVDIKVGFIDENSKKNFRDWHELGKQGKCSSLTPPKGIFYDMILNELGRVSN